jgi:hypothetical protein
MRASALFLISVFLFSFLFIIKGLDAVEFLPTSVEVQLSCGDGYAEYSSGEVCDPGFWPIVPADVGTSTCLDFLDIFGNNFEDGRLGCADDCSDFSTDLCFTCGNSYKETPEECDGSDFGGKSCVSLGYSGGTLACTSFCRYNITDCESRTNPGGIAGSGNSGGSYGSVNTGFDPGSDTEQISKVVVRGKAYPNSEVHILVDGRVAGIVAADPKADFYFESDEIPAGVASFGFWSEDSGGLKSTLLTLTLRVISNAVTNISGVNIAPSIEVDKKTVRQGEVIKIYGQTVPETKINIHIHSEQEFIEEAQSASDGNWQINFDTTPLEVDFHTAKALFLVEQNENIIKSGFSRSVSFHVGKVGGEAACAEADLNHDGRVNLTDFSILLYYWDTDNECADQNQNGKVDLVDFSIMMYYWTG